MKYTLVQLRHVTKFNYGDALPLDNTQNGEYKVYGSNGAFSLFTRANTLAPVIILGRKGSYGKVNWSDFPCFASDTTFFIDESTTKHNLRWIYWVLQTLKLDEGTDEAAIPGLNREFAYSKRIFLPTRTIQHRIADYLDRETARIDALMAAKQRALNLLAEKRKAVIAEAVTRGLDQSVPLRESGVAWLGKIPAHWSIIPIKYGFDLIGSGTTPPTNNAEYYDGNILWVTTSELRENLVKNTQQKITELALQKFSALKVYPSGSLLFAMYGATIGRVAILGCESAVNQAVCVISQEKLFTTQFVFFALQIFRDQLIAEASGGGQPNLNAEKLKSFLLGCPFLSEQHAIVKHITRETAKLDALVATTERSIALLNERRAALISAAVTGQLAV